jgi:hypothetical protein
MALQDDLKKAEAALADPKVKSFTYQGKRYTLTQLRDELIPSLKKAIQAEQEAETQAGRIIAGNQAEVDRARNRVQDAQEIVTRDRNAFAKNNLSEQELTASEQRLAQAQAALNALTGAATVPTVSATNVAGPNVRVGVGRTATPRVTSTQTGAVTTTTETEPTTTTPTTTTGATTGAAPAKTKKKKKAAAPAGTGPMGITDALRAEIRTLFPQFASSFDGGENEQQFVDFFGSDLVTVLVKAASEDAYGQLETDAEVAAFKRDVENTAYGQRTNQFEQDFDFSPGTQAEKIRVKKNEITKQYADLQLDMQQLDTIARDAARKGWSGDDLKFAVYSYAYGAKPTTAMQSELADRIRNAGRAYGYVVSDAELKAALTNTPYNGMMVTEASILQKAQRTAKGQYAHLADQIDAGVSLDDIFYNYKAYAARTLGVDPSEIDFVNDPKWAEAFGSKEQGQLSLNDWLFKIKSDKRYGYQFTPQAQEEVSSIVSSLEKAFGFRK